MKTETFPVMYKPVSSPNSQKHNGKTFTTHGKSCDGNEYLQQFVFKEKNYQ